MLLKIQLTFVYGTEFTFYAPAWPCPGYSHYKETWIMLVS